MVVSNANGTDSITKTAYITVNLCLPTAGFTSSTNQVCETACAGFTDQSTDSPTSWAWSFPGATPDTSNVQNPLGVCYDTAGNYDVTLIVSNLSGSDTLVMTDYMTVLSCPTPISDFAPSDSEICSGDCITFTNSSQNAINWFWSFENGTPSSSFVSDPGSVCFSGPPGYYNVRLVTSNGMGSDTLNSSILIDSAVADIVIGDTLFENMPSSFTDNSISPVSWDWNFGDGNSTNIQNPIYTYTNAGTYTVMLIISNDNGCVDTATKVVTVVQLIGQEELFRKGEMVIYPNPASSTLYIELDIPMGESNWVKIENTLGQLVYEDQNPISQSSVIELDIAFLPKGIYYVNIGNSRGIAVNKFIRQ